MGHPCALSLACASYGDDFPIWSCSVRGFACHPCCHGRGALLPHLFTIAFGNVRLKPDATEWAVCFLCHCPSSCPDRVLPGALPCGVRTFLPPSLSINRISSYGPACPCGVCRAEATGRQVLAEPAAPKPEAQSIEGEGGRSSGPLRSRSLYPELERRRRDIAPKREGGLAVGFLGDLILLEFLIEIAAGRIDDFGGLRDVPAILAQLADEKRTLGVVLELAQRSRLRPVL